MFRKANKFLSGGGDAEPTKAQDDEGESLTTVLENDEDRSALTILICDITELMRKRLIDTFNPKETGSQLGQVATHTDENGVPLGLDQMSDDEQKKETQESSEKESAELSKLERELGEEKMVALKTSALKFFDDWRDSIIIRVGEVVNSRETAQKQSKQAKPKETSSSDLESNLDETVAGENEGLIAEVLLKIYAPIETPLRKVAREKRMLILHSVLLLVLSLEHYNAHSRILLLYLTTSLGLPVTVLSEDEQKVARGLLTAAEKMSADEEAKERADQNRTARRWKMGIAGVAGAALIGITGGLAAPLLASGLGTVLGGIGLGATATAGYLGALAGSGVLVGSLFGAYGARMTSKAMEQYTRDVEDFAFVPTYQPECEKEARRLRVAIGISGWLGNKDDVVGPWKCIGPGQETFALRFELESLMNLGNALTTLVTSTAWSYAKSEIIKRTLFAALTAGLWPLALLKARHLIDNPWYVANQRAQKAGEVLADAIINKAQGERPVTLVGYSLGAKVICVCLQQLAERRAFGLVENAIILGAPVPSNSADWRRFRSVVTGRIVNAYSTKDYILAFLSRTSSIQFGVAGLSPVLDVKGVENVEVGDLVNGHTLYRHATAPILKRIGFEDLDFQELGHEEQKLAEQEKDEENQRKAAETDSNLSVASGEEGMSDEVKKMEREIEQKNNTK
ncbi:DUF726-domain-containing protein [Annulohypoxylon truncatum]|uniref:DUF726-domain-containing protein n=1 Tax=Annulohypoxylon truncatum TaxID=327061 RepID=UPI0020072A72|nr:DUF726-domain-containing protein [Annulohypoxylon truncatum]KAI1205066.1 DUF726-domain-containing protein [Annulohypoxylon truncatum]